MANCRIRKWTKGVISQAADDYVRYGDQIVLRHANSSGAVGMKLGGFFSNTSHMNVPPPDMRGNDCAQRFTIDAYSDTAPTEGSPARGGIVQPNDKVFLSMASTLNNWNKCSAASDGGDTACPYGTCASKTGKCDGFQLLHTDSGGPTSTNSTDTSTKAWNFQIGSGPLLYGARVWLVSDDFGFVTSTKESGDDSAPTEFGWSQTPEFSADTRMYFSIERGDDIDPSLTGLVGTKTAAMTFLAKYRWYIAVLALALATAVALGLLY